MRYVVILTLAFTLLIPWLANAGGGSRKPLTANGAAELAAKLANAEANRRFNHRPFSARNGRAVIQRDATGQQRWRWGATVGFGLGDLSARVFFDRDGSRPSVSVQPAMSMPQQMRLDERMLPDQHF